MKKITLLAAAFAVSSFVSAQTVISQSVDPVTVDDGGAACWSSPGSGGSGDYRENSFYRTYDLANDFGISTTFDVGSVQIGQAGAVDGTVINVTLYAADTFPGGTLVPLNTEQFTLSSADDLTLVELPFVAQIPANVLTVLEVNVPESANGTASLRFFPGTNGSGQNAPSYLEAESCGITVPTETGTGSAPAAEYVFNLSDEVLAVNNAIASQVSLYPNPVNNVLNVSIPSSIQIEGATMYDILGKGTQVEISANNTINTSSLASGVYLLSINTNEGNITKKIVKQ